jgi:hypothetical protein
MITETANKVRIQIARQRISDMWEEIDTVLSKITNEYTESEGEE